ncbi:TfoX/Sxy family protein [Thioclava sp. FR2]|uniref:TfoX/Sxy family protein n=1 Tax=Thioclava sp. FR2 TaxID=3445780 RepID=UPI003EBF1D52
MAWDEGLAQLLRDELAGQPITEKKMFGGLAFLLNGHMVCGVHKGGAMVRVGKDRYQKALTVDGVSPMMFTGKPMSGMVDVTDEACVDDTRRSFLIGLALATVSDLPPKPAPKPRKKATP